MAAYNNSVTQDGLHELLHYDPATGVFVWRVQLGKAFIGARAGSPATNGYLRIGIDGVRYAAHRLAWIYVHGVWPSEIDHIDGDRINNAIDNLREATRQQNNGNSRGSHSSRSGIKGVVYDSRRRKWRARIMVNYREQFIGRFATREEAVVAYAEAAQRHFGEFARFKP